MNIRLLALTILLPLPAAANTTAKGEAVIGNDLREARSLFQAATSQARKDCDPLGDGRWICASYNNPSIQDFITGESGRYSGQPIAVTESTLVLARQKYSEATVLPRVDCDPIAGQWICASFNNPEVDDLTDLNTNVIPDRPVVDATVDPATVAAIVVANPVQGSQTTDITQPSSSANAGHALPENTLYQYGDLLSLNYDSCPDPDDLHAAVAAKMVLDHYGLENGTDYIVTNGTCGDLRPRTDYITDSYKVFDELYFIYWNDAFRDENFSISQVGDKYLSALETGNRVWVLDGGPMDFTARVIAYMKGVGTSADLKNITVIQHSHGWNEEHTDPANLQFMEQHVTYLKIDNGNHQNNRTPQLNQSNQQAAFPNVDPALVNRFASDSRYSSAWALAFNQLSTQNRLDGSDTVELLWALGLTSNEIKNWYAFADLFIPDANSQADSIGSTDTDTDTDTDTRTGTDTDTLTSGSSNSSTTLRLEAESAVLGAGWVLESARSGFNGTGYIRWSEGNQYLTSGKGITQYVVKPIVSGIHTVQIRARAINPPASDLNNDVWMRMNGKQAQGSTELTAWAKVFTTGQDTWQLGGTVDKAHSMELFKQELVAGQLYTLELSGRSTNYAIDYLEIKPAD